MSEKRPDRNRRKKKASHDEVVVPTLEELVSQINAENRYPKVDIGPDRGKEIVIW